MAWSSVHYLSHAQEKKKQNKNKTKQKHKRAMMMISIFLALGHMYFDLILFQMSKLHYCFPFSGERSSVKCSGMIASDSFSSHPSPFFSQTRRAPSLTSLLARLFDFSAWKRKGNGCYVG